MTRYQIILGKKPPQMVDRQEYERALHDRAQQRAAAAAQYYHDMYEYRYQYKDALIWIQ